MTTVINFKSAQDTESQKNLEFFISTNKKNFIFPNNDWNDNIWDITSFLKDKINDNKSKKVYFRSVTDHSTSKNEINISMSEPLIDFAKAVFCQIMREKKLYEYKRI